MEPPLSTNASSPLPRSRFPAKRRVTVAFVGDVAFAGPLAADPIGAARRIGRRFTRRMPLRIFFARTWGLARWWTTSSRGKSRRFPCPCTGRPHPPWP